MTNLMNSVIILTEVRNAAEEIDSIISSIGFGAYAYYVIDTALSHPSIVSLLGQD
jgi:hypothetical protein